MGLWIDVKKLRKERGWLQQESAEQLGVSRAYLSTVETGKRGISINMMEAIMKVFNVKYEDFHTSVRKGDGMNVRRNGSNRNHCDKP